MRIKISKADINVPATLSYHYDFDTRFYGSHRAFVYLSTDGKYQMKIDGVEYSTHEPSAKRSPLYSKAITTLSNYMLSAMNEYNEAYVNIAKQSLLFRNREKIEKLIGKIELKKYTRRDFTYPRPTKDEVKEDLFEESEAKYFSLWSKRQSKKEKFIEEHIDEEYRKREVNWLKLKSYHDSIEKNIEHTVNSQYQQEYYNKRMALEDVIRGDEEYVRKKFSELVGELKFPWPIDIFLDLNYSKKEKLIEAVVTIPLDFMLPEKKAFILSSGKISVKNKLKGELDTDTSTALLGLSYYLCSRLFDITTHVETIRLSVVSSLYAYYWVEFDRSSLFNSLNPISSLDPINDFFHHPNVLDFKRNSISQIPLDDFRPRVQDAIRIAKKLARDNKLGTISLSDAEAICKRLSNVQDLQKAISFAKKNNTTMVIVDKKYVNIIRELNVIDDKDTEPDTTDSSPVETKRHFSSLSNVSPLLEDAAKMAIKHFKYSVGMLQDDLSLDELAATKLMNKLKSIGIVGAPDSEGFYPLLIDSEAQIDFKLSWTSQ